MLDCGDEDRRAVGLWGAVIGELLGEMLDVLFAEVGC